MNLVFVCTGNICRSPMAEGMFKKLLEEKGRERYRLLERGTCDL